MFGPGAAFVLLGEAAQLHLPSLLYNSLYWSTSSTRMIPISANWPSPKVSR